MRFHGFQGVSVGIIYLRAAPVEIWRWERTKKANSDVRFSWIWVHKLLGIQQCKMPQMLTQRGPRMGLSIPGTPRGSAVGKGNFLRPIAHMQIAQC